MAESNINGDRKKQEDINCAQAETVSTRSLPLDCMRVRSDSNLSGQSADSEEGKSILRKKAVNGNDSG